MENVNYSLDQITGILTQQLQLLRNMKESNDAYTQSVPFFGTSFNPFSSSQSTVNPFKTGFANATGATSGQHVMNAFGLPTAAQLGIGLGVNMFQRKVGSTDVSTIGTVPATSGFGFFQNASKINYEERMMAAAHMGDKLSTGALNLAGTALSVFGGWPGMIAGAGFTLAADQVKQQNAYNKYLLQNSYRFINYGESTNTRGMGGFGLNERMDAANFLRRFGTENLISDADTQKLLKTFTEGDLLRNTKDLKDFKENMTKLTKAIKEGALALGETYESMAGLMSEMKKLGMDPTKINSYAAGAKAIQGMTGLNASGTLSNLMSFAGSMAQGTGMTVSNLYANAQGALLYTNSMYDSLYEKAMTGDQSAQRNLNLINNLGGIEGAYQSILGAEQQVLQSGAANSQFIGVLYHDWNENTHTWEFNQSKFDDMIKNAGNRNLTVEAQKAMYGYSDIAKSAWLEQGAELTMGNLDSYEMIQYLSATMNSIKQNNSVYRNKNMSTKDMLRMFFGLSGANAELLGEYIDNGIADGGATLRQHESLTRSQEIIDRANASAVSIGYGAKRYWEGAKDKFGDFFSPFAEGTNAISQMWHDWWNGYEYNISDTQSKHGANTIEESTRIVENALDDLSKSIEKLGDSTTNSREKINSLKNSIDKEKNNTSSIGGNYISAEDLYSLSMNAKGGFFDKAADFASKLYEYAPTTSSSFWGGLSQRVFYDWMAVGLDNMATSEITEEEFANYNSSLRSYLGVDASVSDDKMIIQAAQEANRLAKLSDADWAKMSKEEALSKKQFVASFENMYGSYMSKEGRKAANNLADEIEDSAESIGSESSLTKKEIDSKIKELDSDIAAKRKLMQEASASGNTALANQYADEIAELEKQQNDFMIISDETSSRLNQNNVAIGAIGSAMGWSDEKIKGYLLNHKKQGQYSYVDTVEQQNTVTAAIAAEMTSLINSGMLKSSTKGKEFAAMGINLDDLIAHAGNQEYISQMAAQYVASYINDVSTTATDDLGETSKETKDSMKDLNDATKQLAATMWSSRDKIATALDS